MKQTIETILSKQAISTEHAIILGQSRDDRDILAYQFGSGSKNISLIAGSHADEPVGPFFLRKLCEYFRTSNSPLLEEYTFWIVPHCNPDGEIKNARWWNPAKETVDLIPYLKNRVRELPGEDIEFGYPESSTDSNARPENQALYHWWQGNSFALHISFHGMGFSGGPWFLVEKDWHDKGLLQEFSQKALQFVDDLNYVPHDVEREGEKGFWRLQQGFCSRPDSKEMKKHFLALKDETTANLFKPSSMEIMNSLGDSPLTLVSELPLFVLPGIGKTLGPPDPVYSLWKTRISQWQLECSLDPTLEEEKEILDNAKEWGLEAMPVSDQMKFQAFMLLEGLKAISL